MAQTTKKKNGALPVDEVYNKFTRSILRSLGSNEFYQFFMDAVSKADNEIQFSNRKEVKSIDPAWVDAVEESLQGLQHIINLPRQEIKEDELIVNVAHAKKTGQDVVRHLASHAGMVENYDEETGSVRPSRVMQKYREESLGLYENRLVFTTLEMAYHFVKIRHDALFQAMNDEFGAKLKLRTDMESATEKVHLDMFLHIRNTESILDTDAKNRDMFDRISRLYRVLGVFMNSPFARQMTQFERVKGAIHKTNILKRNPDYRAAVKLLEFLRSYDQIGYAIAVVEQNPEVDETFQRDIFHNVLFNYIVLKGHLEDERDRALPVKRKPKQRTLKPKFIHQIIEELTEDYDLPDVEIRKVLIEELTKEQLMQEEKAERLRLVEEQKQRKLEEARQAKEAQEAERQRIRAEKAAEQERIRKEKELQKQKELYEQMQREAELRRRKNILAAELEYFRDHLPERIEQRRIAREKAEEARRQQEYLEAQRLKEEQEQRRREEAQRQQIRDEQAQRQERLLRQQEDQERRRQERAKREEEARQLRQNQRREAREQLAPMLQELEKYRENIQNGKQERRALAERIEQEAQRRQEEIRQRRAQRR